MKEFSECIPDDESDKNKNIQLKQKLTAQTKEKYAALFHHLLNSMEEHQKSRKRHSEAIWNNDDITVQYIQRLDEEMLPI